MTDSKKHPNDDYINPVSPTAAAPIPPEIRPEDVESEQSDSQGGTLSEGGSGGTKAGSDSSSARETRKK